MIIDERLSTYIDSISWSIPEYLKEVEKEALAVFFKTGVPIIRRPMQSLISFLLTVKKTEGGIRDRYCSRFFKYVDE